MDWKQKKWFIWGLFVACWDWEWVSRKPKIFYEPYIIDNKLQLIYAFFFPIIYGDCEYILLSSIHGAACQSVSPFAYL